jgi:hypothetical protein
MNWKPKQRELKTEAEIASLTRADWDRDAALPWPTRPLWDGPDLDAAFDAKVDELFPELASLQQRVKDSFAAGEDSLRLELFPELASLSGRVSRGTCRHPIPRACVTRGGSTAVRTWCPPCCSTSACRQATRVQQGPHRKRVDVARRGPNGPLAGTKKGLGARPTFRPHFTPGALPH